jgi:hypothetical protein
VGEKLQHLLQAGVRATTAERARAASDENRAIRIGSGASDRINDRSVDSRWYRATSSSASALVSDRTRCSSSSSDPLRAAGRGRGVDVHRRVS